VELVQRSWGKLTFPIQASFAFLFLLFNRRIIIIIHSKQRHVPCHFILHLKNNSLYTEYGVGRIFSRRGVTYRPEFSYKWHFAVTERFAHKANDYAGWTPT
jgi:hypothetical protein